MSYKEIPDVTLKMIIDSKIIKIGTKVYASSDNNIVGTINKEGAIILDIENEKRIFPYPSGAARAITKTSVNGWKFWKTLENGQFKELSNYKEKYKREE